MNNICNNLLQTFNTNILDKEKKIIQAAFYSQAKKFKNTNKDNTIFKLIRNHYENKKPNVKKIGGPFHLTKHIKDDIIIYIFGERHSEIIDCKEDNTLIENYLAELLENTDVFIDMYFEFPGFTYQQYLNTNLMAEQHMQRLFKKFYKCIQTLTRKSEKCELSRIHYIDTRSTDINRNTSELLEFSNIYRNINKYIDIPGNKNFMIKKIFSIPSNNNEEFIDFWIKQFENEQKIQKEINKSIYKNEINLFIRNKIIDKIYELPGLTILQNLKKDIINQTINNSNFKYYLEVFSTYVGNYVAVYIDGYALSRIFKEFKIENKIMQPKSPKNIIIYAEDRHSQNYRDFIETIGFIKSEESNQFYRDIYLPDKNRYCLDMSPIKQPFFS